MRTWVTLARVIPSRRAMLAWLAISPASSSRRHWRALRSVSTTGCVRGFRGGLGRLARRELRHAFEKTRDNVLEASSHGNCDCKPFAGVARVPQDYTTTSTLCLVPSF